MWPLNIRLGPPPGALEAPDDVRAARPRPPARLTSRPIASSVVAHAARAIACSLPVGLGMSTNALAVATRRASSTRRGERAGARRSSARGGGGPRVANSSIWRSRSSPQSSSMMCVQPASRYSSIAAMQSAGRAGDRLAAVEDLVADRGRRGEPPAALHRLGDRADLLLAQPGQLEQHVGGALDVLDLVGEVHAGDLARALAAAWRGRASIEATIVQPRSICAGVAPGLARRPRAMFARL